MVPITKICVKEYVVTKKRILCQSKFVQKSIYPFLHIYKIYIYMYTYIYCIYTTRAVKSQKFLKIELN